VPKRRCTVTTMDGEGRRHSLNLQAATAFIPLKIIGTCSEGSTYGKSRRAHGKAVFRTTERTKFPPIDKPAACDSNFC
jgi:hypothetical protein